MTLNCLIANCVASINLCLKHKIITNRCIYSKYVLNVIIKLHEEGIIKSYTVLTATLPHKIEYKMFYFSDMFLIQNITLISKPTSQIYLSFNKLSVYLEKFQRVLVSTTKGILNHRECMKEKLGGKVILGFR